MAKSRSSLIVHAKTRRVVLDRMAKSRTREQKGIPGCHAGRFEVPPSREKDSLSRTRST